jgi:hypothetical protein
MPAMGRVTKGAEIGVVRRHDNESAAWRKQAVEFFHRPNHVRNVFNDMNRPNLLEGGIAEGKRIVVQICQNIRLGVGVTVNSDRAGIFVHAAPDIENGKPIQCG